MAKLNFCFEVTLENDASKLHDNSDWESCQSKCILVKFFLAEYCSQSTQKNIKKGKQEVYNSLPLCLFSLGTQSTVAPRARAPYGFFFFVHCCLLLVDVEKNIVLQQLQLADHLL